MKIMIKDKYFTLRYFIILQTFRKNNILLTTSKSISAHCDSVIALIYVGNSPRGSGDGRRLYDVILVSGSLKEGAC